LGHGRCRGRLPCWAAIIESILQEYANLQDMDQWIVVHDEMRAHCSLPFAPIEARVACTYCYRRAKAHPQAEYWVAREGGLRT
jgi:hypothetical protein